MLYSIWCSYMRHCYSFFLLCSYIDHSSRILLDKQVKSDYRKAHYYGFLSLCVIMCIMAVESIHHLAISGSYSSKMKSCLPRWSQYVLQLSRACPCDILVLYWGCCLHKLQQLLSSWMKKLDEEEDGGFYIRDELTLCNL